MKSEIKISVKGGVKLLRECSKTDRTFVALHKPHLFIQIHKITDQQKLAQEPSQEILSRPLAGTAATCERTIGSGKQTIAGMETFLGDEFRSICTDYAQGNKTRSQVSSLCKPPVRILSQKFIFYDGNFGRSKKQLFLSFGLNLFFSFSSLQV